MSILILLTIRGRMSPVTLCQKPLGKQRTQTRYDKIGVKSNKGMPQFFKNSWEDVIFCSFELKQAYFCQKLKILAQHLKISSDARHVLIYMSCVQAFDWLRCSPLVMYQHPNQEQKLGHQKKRLLVRAVGIPVDRRSGGR